MHIACGILIVQESKYPFVKNIRSWIILSDPTFLKKKD